MTAITKKSDIHRVISVPCCFLFREEQSKKNTYLFVLKVNPNFRAYLLANHRNVPAMKNKPLSFFLILLISTSCTAYLSNILSKILR